MKDINYLYGQLPFEAKVFGLLIIGLAVLFILLNGSTEKGLGPSAEEREEEQVLNDIDNANLANNKAMIGAARLIQKRKGK